MNEITYKDIDLVLVPWAAAHKLHLFTECKDEETRAMILTDQWGDQYELYAVPDWQALKTMVRVGADLTKRGTKKHTFYRERKQYHFLKTIEYSKLSETLDEALDQTTKWGSTRHTDAKNGAEQTAAASPSLDR